jgi:hypothetical protein
MELSTMKLQHIKTALLGLIFCAANVSATLITLETRDINQEFSRSDLLSSWNQSTQGVKNNIDASIPSPFKPLMVSPFVGEFDQAVKLPQE